MKRELAGAVAIPIVLVILFKGPAILFNGLVAVVALGAVWEFYRIAEKTGHPVAKTVGLAGSALLLGGAALLWGPFRFETPAGDLVQVAVKTRPSFWFVAALTIVFLVAIAPMASRVPPASALAGAASTIFGIVSIALPATAMCLLRGRSPRAVLMLLLIVWVCDSAAYYFGRMFGRRPLAPVVSPKKTWEGTIGGLVAATLFGAAAGTWWFLPELGPVRGALAGALASTAGQIGDLVESLWKRGAGVKDSGTFLPGHGGFYDRIDSLLFAAPVLAAFVGTGL
ncbi:MAG: phosphatidate cytidylyltransferase [Thermoanaerobaculia bacterium]